MRFGKEETSTEEKRRRLRRLVPSWSFLTRLRRPYLFPCAGKDRGEKGAWMRLVLSASEFRREPIFQASFHTIVTLRASYYAPPDTGGIEFDTSCLRTIAINRRYSGNPDGCYFFAGKFSLFAGTKCLPPGEGVGVVHPKASPMMRINS